MSSPTKWPVAVAALSGLILGVVGTSAVFVLRSGSESPSASSASSSFAPLQPQTTTSPSQALPSDISSAGPPPPPPTPPQQPPQPMPTAANQPSPQQAKFTCSVRLETGPGEQASTLLIVQAPPDVEMMWGMITSGEQRTGGAISLVEGRGEQVVVGFKANESQVVMYADPSMNPATEACRSA